MEELLIIEARLEDYDDIELTGLFLDDLKIKLSEVLSAEKPERKHIILAAFGSHEALLPVIEDARNEFSLQAHEVLLFGKSPYSSDEIEATYSLECIKAGADRYERAVISEGAREQTILGTSPIHCISHAIWSEMDNVARAAKEGDPIRLHEAVVRARNVFFKIPGDALKAALIRSLEGLYETLALEIAFFYGEETRSIGSYLSDSYLKDLESNPIFNLETRYSVEKKTLALDTLETRIDFIKAGIDLRKDFRKHLNSRTTPGLFVWFSSYLLRLALLSCSKQQYSTGISLAMRALEAYCQAILIENGGGEFSDDEKHFLVKGKKTKGLGDLWSASLEIKDFAVDEPISKGIWHSIELRNKSVLGHGVMHPSKAMFDHAYGTVKKIIKNYEEVRAPRANLWPFLLEKAFTNVFTNLERQIASKALSLLHFYPI